MSNIIVNAPIQNKAFEADERPGKVVPLFVADWARTSLPDYEDQLSPIELWNNVLASEQGSLDDDAYELQMQERLKYKYDSELLTHLHADGNVPDVLTDTSPDFLAWAGQKIETAFERGDLRIKSLGVYACQACEATLAVAEGPQPEHCILCPEDSEIGVEQRSAVTAEITPQIDSMVELATNTKNNSQQIYGDFIVNKRRAAGISLEKYGFEGDVVDPRIGLGLLALYAASAAEADRVDVVASRATVRQNVPQFFAATARQQAEMPKLHTRGIAKAPVNYLLHLRSEGVFDNNGLATTLRDTLSPALLAMHRDMSPASAEELIYSRKAKKRLQNY